MNFAEVEREVAKLRQDLAAGRLTEGQCKTRMRELMVQDEDGNWWMVGYETGEWYRHDGTDWVRADPPGRAALEPAPSLTTVVLILYDALKWLWKERERDREEESTEPSPPPEVSGAAPAEAAPRPPASTPAALLAVLREGDLAVERAALDRLSSLGRQLESRRENINFYEEGLAEIPVGRERLNLRKGFRRERAEIERIAQEMQEIVERLSGHQVVVAE